MRHDRRTAPSKTSLIAANANGTAKGAVQETAAKAYASTAVS
jgi:hypothetical protein